MHASELLIIHKRFWGEQPALLLGLSAAIGIGFALFSVPVWVGIVWTLYLILLRKWASIAGLVSIGVYAWLLYGGLPTMELPNECTARFSISSLQKHQSPFYQDVVYRGTLYHGRAALPCSIYARGKRATASRDYQVTGFLKRKNDYEFTLQVKRWEPVEWTWSLAELRYQMKEQVRTYLRENLIHARAAMFLSSLATGEIEDRQLRFEFGRLGLQHLLAISGFHFGVILLFFSSFLGFFFPPRWTWVALFVVSSLYFIFIGSSPPVQRAWLTTTLFLWSKWLKRPCEPSNLLGAALLLEVLWNPLVVQQIGFQLTFGCCLGIFLLHPSVDLWLTALFPKRTAVKSLQLPFFSKCMYLLAGLFRSSLGLGLAVHLAILPLLLYHFGKFPYLSLLYNLFYPFLLSLALFGLLTAILASLLLSSLGSLLFFALDRYTNQLLDLTSYPPLALDYSLYFYGFRSDWIFAYAALLLGLALHRKNLDKNPSIPLFF
ncbi:MAG: ComEC/Rec2 family competence protein [Verrucomicrobiota bacterium]|nr:ComEC/Rec2 family competence protein [Verrucomicrobiota bacterium]